MAKNHHQNLLQDLRNWHKQWLTSTSPQIATKAEILAEITAELKYLNHICRRGARPCAPTAWSIYLKIAVRVWSSTAPAKITAGKPNKKENRADVSRSMPKN
ncbi:hypothetical protein PQG02_24325 [Nostoc sp. UHCC 0926]|nr:hypothetical protein [Nostoc sp. UHCC 0926]WDD31786.1 hypothetical protein PQG02_24325 [Nostoc sp. UHCC 0926]